MKHTLTVRARLYWDVHDVWVGIYWKRPKDGPSVTLYLCVVPLLVLKLSLWWHETPF